MVLLRQTTQIIPKFYQNDDSIENDFIYLNQVESQVKHFYISIMKYMMKNSIWK